MNDSNLRLYINGKEISCGTIGLSSDANIDTDLMSLENKTFTVTATLYDLAIFYEATSANRECMRIINRIRDRINVKQLKRRAWAKSKKKFPNMIYIKQDRRLINVRNRI